MVQSSDGGFQRGKWTEAKQDHTGMRLMLHEDELTKIPVVGDERAALPVGDSEDIGIGQARRMIADDPCNIVAPFFEIQDDAQIGALVQQKSHALEAAGSATDLAAARASFLCRERR
jgi:hypothetical protein